MRVYFILFKKLSKSVQDLLARANEVAEEVFSSMRTVRSFAGELHEVRRYKNKMADVYKLNKKEAAVYAGYVWCNSVSVTL